MPTITQARMEDFKGRLRNLSRKELLDIIRAQNPDYIKQINRIEYVFKHKLRHLTWKDGSTVDNKDFTKEELMLLVDPPFQFNRELAKAGFTEAQQRQAHIAADPVLWAKAFLEDVPRAYQSLIMRDPSRKKVMRMGRRLGKTATMAFYSLWYAYTNREAKILILAPMKSHVALIYDEILRMAKQNPIILNDEKSGCAITRFVASPQYQIDFENGSQIKFFTTGMKSNSKADVARGQEADVIILDEMDYMGKDDLDALMAMMQKTSDRKTTEKKLIGASTPTGQRGTFYKWCTDPEQGYSAYWYPCQVNPFWDKEMEKEMRVLYSKESAWRHEIEADWGEDSEGVYPHKFVKTSFLDVDEYEWPYDAQPHYGLNHSTYVMGVDWDKYGAGVNIVVLEKCHDDHPNPEYANKIRLAHREEMEKSDFAYLEACKRIIHLNEVFRPKHIYADRGAGEAQIEILHKHGMSNPSSNLHKVLEGKAFYESIEVMDPFTQEPVKKRLKSFMVDNLYRMLENEMILFPGHDTQLFEALLGYVVLRVSATTNEPVFAPGGETTDHAHDALILACFAIANNYDELLNPKYASKLFVVSNEVFLPTIEAEVKTTRDDIDAPVRAHRSMAYTLGGKVKRNPITRKSF